MDNKLSLKNAINEAISYRIENDILYDILIKHKSEVESMILTEYNEKQHMKTVRKEGYEEGAMSRQPEVDALHSEVCTLHSEVGTLYSEIDTLNLALKEKDEEFNIKVREKDAEIEKFKSLLIANGIEIDK